MPEAETHFLKSYIEHILNKSVSCFLRALGYKQLGYPVLNFCQEVINAQSPSCSIQFNDIIILPHAKLLRALETPLFSWRCLPRGVWSPPAVTAQAEVEVDSQDSPDLPLEVQRGIQPKRAPCLGSSQGYGGSQLLACGSIKMGLSQQKQFNHNDIPDLLLSLLSCEAHSSPSRLLASRNAKARLLVTPCTRCMKTLFARQCSKRPTKGPKILTNP